MSTEPKTGLTYWAAGILQPDLLFNALLQRFGAVGGQPTVKDKDLATPPGSPAAGDTYIVAGSPTGAWVGHAGHIAYYDAAWYFFTPAEGWRVDVVDEDLQYRYTGAAWVTAAASDFHAATSKTTPVDADEIPLADSAASFALKKLTWANLKAGLFAAWGALVAAGTSKATPVDGDSLAISDSAASDATKKLTFANLKAWAKTYFDTLYGALGSINTWALAQTFTVAPVFTDQSGSRTALGAAPLASPIFTGDHTVSQADFRTGAIAPAALAANTNDWAPTGFSTCSIIRASGTAARAITGLAGGAAGRRVTVHNVGSFDLLVTNEDTGSSAANRFAIRRGLIIPPNSSAVFWYDTTSSRWRQDGDRERTVTVVLPSDQTNNNAVADTLQDVTGLSFDVIAGKVYRFRFQIAYDSAATTTGARWTINGPAVTSLRYRQNWSSGVTTSTERNNPANTYESGAVSAESMVDGNLAEVWGTIQPSADGTVIARFSSEISGSAVVAKANISFVEYECLTA